MRASAVGLTFIILVSDGVVATAYAQPAAPVSIPLTYWEGANKLAINVGINGGAARPYIFDTGSPVFNAVYNPSWWPNMPPNPNANNAPSSSLLTSAQFCLGGGSPTSAAAIGQPRPGALAQFLQHTIGFSTGRDVECQPRLCRQCRIPTTATNRAQRTHLRATSVCPSTLRRWTAISSERSARATSRPTSRPTPARTSNWVRGAEQPRVTMGAACWARRSCRA